MTGPTERVILIKGDPTKWYNQAIFIVNQNTPATKMPVDFVAEAERIIYNHMARQKYQATSKKAAAPAAYTYPEYPTKQASSVAPASRTAAKKSASKFDFVLNMIMILACIAIVAVFTYGLMS
ncbi:MAG: hypothetical protein FWB96_10780 [Defluviitaleaceae bacterium]|nr:hypothetical protein [Defluviitaleaceae bacterium]MCL2263370.1 hypothetical protein [Defluviitaleaceae bacterium]